MKILRILTQNSTRILLMIILSVMIFVSVSSFDKKYDKNANAIKNLSEIENVSCNIVSFPVSDDGKTKFTGKIIQSPDSNLNGLKMNISIKEITEYGFRPGDTVVITNGTYFPPSAESNEGGFDLEQYNKSENTYGNIYTKEKVVLKSEGKNVFIRKLSDIRSSFLENTDSYFKPNIAGIAKALVSGERFSISSADSTNLKSAGVYHIVAISGLHLNIFIMFITFFLSALKLKRMKKALISGGVCLLTATFVLIFTGMGLSVIRAFVMLVISLGSGIFARKYNAKNSLFIATAIILICLPSSFYSTGFHLSVLSTFGVLVSADILKKLKNNPSTEKFASSGIISVIVTSVMCGIFTLPVMINAFGFIPVHSWLANLLILPLATPALGLCIVFAFASVCGFAAIAEFAAYPVTALIWLILKISAFIAHLPMSTANLYPQYTLYLVILGLTLSLSIYLIYKKKFKACVILGLIFVVAVSGFLMYNNKADNAQVIFADVGQGDCAVINLPGNEAFMVDFGSTSEEEYIYDEIKSTLTKLNIKKVSAAFVSHLHQDHMSGITELVQNGYVKKLIIPKYYDKSDKESRENVYKLMEAALRTNTEVHYIKEGSVIKSGENAVFEILSPDGEMFLDTNNMSAVIKFSYGDVSFLFTGDIEEDGTKLLYEKDIDCDVLKMPHHGGKNELGDWLIESSSPLYAVVSCGEDNQYNHPHPDVIKSLEDRNVQIYRTDRMGAIRFDINKKEVKSVEKMR